MVPFTAATVAAPVTASKSVRKHVGGGNVLPPTDKPKGYSLSDIAKATAFFSTSGPDNRSEATEPNVPFQVLYDSNVNDPHNTFFVGPSTTFYVPIFYSDDSPPITGNFPDVRDQKAVEKYLSSHKELGAEFIEIEVDGKVTSIKKAPRHFQWVAGTDLMGAVRNLRYGCQCSFQQGAGFGNSSLPCREPDRTPRIAGKLVFSRSGGQTTSVIASALAPSPTARNTESCKPNHKIQQFSAINSRMVTLPDLRLVIVKRRTYLLKALQRRSGTGPASPGLSMVPAFARDYEAKKNSSRSIL